MRYWINLTGSDPADADWYDTLAEAEDAAFRQAAIFRVGVTVGLAFWSYAIVFGRRAVAASTASRSRSIAPTAPPTRWLRRSCGNSAPP